MTPNEILASLSRGDPITPELHAAICVALQYVPGVPEARNVRVNEELPERLRYETDTFMIGCNVPDLSTLNAIKALEKAKGPWVYIDTMQKEDGTWYALYVDDRANNASFHAPTEPHARLGALVKMLMEERR